MLSEFETCWLNVSRGGNTKPGATLGECVTHMGTVGWESEAEHFFPGSDSDDGFTLVRVTLYEGRSFSDPPSPGVAQGHQIICHIGSGVYRVPPKGTRVFVTLPKGLEHQPGAGVITQSVEKSPSEQFDEKRVTFDCGADNDLVLQAGVGRFIINSKDNSVSLLTTDSGTRDGMIVGFTISPTALKFFSPWGSIIFDATGFHLKTQAGCRIDLGGMAIPGLSALLPSTVLSTFTTYATMTAGTVKLDGNQIYLGSGAVYNPVVYAVTLPPPPGTPIPSGTPVPVGKAILGGTVWCSL